MNPEKSRKRHFIHKLNVNEPLNQNKQNHPNLNEGISKFNPNRKNTAENNNKIITNKNEQDLIKENIINKNKKMRIEINNISNNDNLHKPKMIEENKIDEQSKNKRKLKLRKINKDNFNTYNNDDENRKLNQNDDINIILPKKRIIKNEIKFNEENFKEDLDSNLNINNLLGNNQNNNNGRNNLPQKRIRRFNTFSNLNDIDKIPQNINFLFDDLNIFDSILLILIYNSFINAYLDKNKTKILSCEKKYKYCLSSILYDIYDYIWESNDEKLKNEKELKKTYQKFLDSYMRAFAKNCDQNFYFNNIDNLVMITKFIYKRINKEITEVNKFYKMPNIKFDNKDLHNYMIKFYETHKSVISDDFTGFYQETTGNIFKSTQKYKSFNCIYFDLSFAQNTGFDTNINLYYCLNHKFNQQNQSIPQNIINFFMPNNTQLKFYSLPRVLTIIINNENGNFIINDEINLSPYTYRKDNHDYYLIAMLCKYNYNDKLILYCLNPKDKNWYYYTKGKNVNSELGRRTTYLEPNAIPYLLVYQKKENNNYEYNKINLEIANNKKGYNFNFINGLQVQLFFGVNATIKEVKREIEKYYKLKKGVKLIINAQTTNNDNDLLRIVNANNSPIMVIQI